MTKYKKSLIVFAVLFILMGVGQLIATATFHRPLEAEEVHSFVHYHWPSNDGVRYEGLYHTAVTLRMQVAALTIAFHTATGLGALIFGFLLLTFSIDRWIDLFGKRPVGAEQEAATLASASDCA